MPLYEAVCMKCGKYHDYVQSVEMRHTTPMCCGNRSSKRVMSIPAAIMDTLEAYESPATGKMITSKSERKRDMKESGCREWEGMKTERALSEQRKKEQEEKLDKAIDASVRQAWANLSPSKKAQALKEAG